MSEWLETEIALLKDYSAREMSAQQMSDALPGRSRNSVIGFCRRNDIPLQSRKLRDYSAEPVKRVRGLKHAPTSISPTERRKHAEVLELFNGAGKMLLMDAGRFDCKWPLGGEPLRPMACGNPIFALSYCQMHFRLAHK